MRRLSRIIFLVILSLTSCDRAGNEAREEFEKSSRDCICLDINGKAIFTYEENTCQISYSENRFEFRVGNDDMSDYYIVRCSSFPHEGALVRGSLTWTTRKDIRERKDLEFKVLKVKDGNTIWLWNQKSRIGVVIKAIN